MYFIQANFELDRLVNKPNIKILKNRVSLEILFPFEFLEFVKNIKNRPIYYNLNSYRVVWYQIFSRSKQFWSKNAYF